MGRSEANSKPLFSFLAGFAIGSVGTLYLTSQKIVHRKTRTLNRTAVADDQFIIDSSLIHVGHSSIM